MGLFKEHFHWTVLLRWDVLAWITGIILAIGGILLVFDQFGGANVCFIITAFLVFAKVAHLAAIATGPAWERMLFVFILCGLIGVGITETVRGVNNYAKTKAAKETKAPTEEKREIKKQEEPATAQTPPSATGNSTTAAPVTHVPPAKPRVPVPQPPTPRLGIGPEAYKDISDEQVGQWAIEEADKISEMASECKSAMLLARQRGGTGDVPKSIFTKNFDDCCAKDVSDLRTEALRRLGPPAKSPKEEEQWAMLTMPRMNGLNMLNPAFVEMYAPHLRLLGLHLKRRAIPRNTHSELHFSEINLPMGVPPTIFNIQITIETKSPLLSGYIVVEFNGKLSSAGHKFVDQTLSVPIISMERIDNKELIDYLSTHNGTSISIAIGKTPFTAEHPIYIYAAAKEPIHATRVMFFEE